MKQITKVFQGNGEVDTMADLDRSYNFLTEENIASEVSTLLDW